MPTTDETVPSKPREPKEAPVARFDGRAYLERTLTRRPSDLLTVRQIPDSDAYRVNWYNAAATTGTIAGLSIRYIRKSEFLFCRLGPDGTPIIAYPDRQ